MIVQLASFTATALQTALALARGRPGLLDEAAIRARLDICAACPKLGADGKCTICGCECNGRAEWFNKLAHRSAACPDDPPRW